MQESASNIPPLSERDPKVVAAENEVLAFIRNSETKPGTTRGLATIDCIDERDNEATYFRAIDEVELEPNNIDRQEQLQLARLRYALTLERRTNREGQIPGYFNQFDQFDQLCMQLEQAQANRGITLHFLSELREEIVRTE